MSTRSFSPRTARWLLFLIIAVALFHWKILFTNQFSIVEDWEAANQGFAWHQFAVSTFKKGILPIWDPYSFSGRTHIGEMQPGVFYPFKLLLYLWPVDSSGMLSERLFLQYHVLARLLAACFMFFLAREVGLRKAFAAFIAGLCFGVGGFVGNAGGLQLLDSAIWLPLILLFFLRALGAGATRAGAINAGLSGVCLGITALAGSVHLPLMDALVIAGAAAFFTAFQPNARVERPARSRWMWSGGAVAIVSIAAFATAAIQLLPAIEYSPLAFRWAGEWTGPALQKIPYWSVTNSAYLPARSLLTVFLPGVMPQGVEFSPYFGVLPLFFAIAGAVVYWQKPAVKFLCGVAVLAFIYGMGPNSLLHGITYLLPGMDKAREADRFIYLTHFALALLAGFGVEAFWTSQQDHPLLLHKVLRAFRIAVYSIVALLAAASVFGTPSVSEWHFFSLICYLAAWGVCQYIVSGHRGGAVRVLVTAIILFDVSAFNWGQLNRAQRHQTGEDYMQQLRAGKGVADFLQSKPGLFRVHVDAEGSKFINLGDMFAVQSTWGQAATSLMDYHLFLWAPRSLDLLNVQYIVSAGKDEPGRLVYDDGRWRVYETPNSCPRAWVVSQVVVDPFLDVVRFRERIAEPGFDPMRVAFVNEPLAEALPDTPEVQSQIKFSKYDADGFELDVNVNRRAFLVLSEMYYPGWEATVNGRPTTIYKTDRFLRGIVVPAGQNHVVFKYRPRSVMLGAALTIPMLLGALAVAVAAIAKRRRNGNATRDSLEPALSGSSASEV
ncbi:MAG: YfhO family protein [Acidobacteria bacterium]|nr:YfhO family protein [Acidobacteriota bacterium]